MRFILVPHPHSLQPAITRFTVDARRGRGGRLALIYRVEGEMDRLVWPGAVRGDGPWTRTDALWRHGCFEAFIARPDDPAYVEINLATGGGWAAYDFSDYRQGVRMARDVTLARADWRVEADRAELRALLDMPADHAGADWRLGLTAVVEDRDGVKSYWALDHGTGPPDFHDRDCFAAALAAAG